jgi:hypothetical protein
MFWGWMRRLRLPGGFSRRRNLHLFGMTICACAARQLFKPQLDSVLGPVPAVRVAERKTEAGTMDPCESGEGDLRKTGHAGAAG